MNPSLEKPQSYTAFAETRLLVSGDLETLLTHLKQALDKGPVDGLLIFEDDNGKQRDFNFQGSLKDVLARALPKAEGPGRPKLGVTSREVSLLPRHWEWLEQQPQGSSAALRRLIDEARKREPNKAQAKKAREAAGKVMWSLGGNLPHFEEASRALYAADLKRFKTQVADWPKDLQTYLVNRLKAAEDMETGSVG